MYCKSRYLYKNTFLLNPYKQSLQIIVVFGITNTVLLMKVVKEVFKVIPVKILDVEIIGKVWNQFGVFMLGEFLFKITVTEL